MSRIVIYGNAPWVPSGYGTQARKLGETLRSHGHDVAYSPFHGLQGVPIVWEGFPVYAGSGEDQWALDVLPAHYRHFQADLLITLMDAWVLDPAKLAGMNLAHWLPVDCSPLGALDRRILDAAGGHPVAMSRFGETQLRDAGYSPSYAPHAIDMSVWKPLEDRAAIREQMGFGDRFVIGVNAANQDPQRKGLGEQMRAFARFAARHDDAVMLVHSRAETRQGLNLARYVDRLGMTGRIVIADQYQLASGMVSEQMMVTWHGACDVLSNCSWGEGFGLAVLQSQAAGTPVIVTDCSSMTELCGAGWLTGGQPFANRGHDADWIVPFVSEIEDAYEKAYLGAGSLRGQARDFAMAYDAERVYQEHWEPVLRGLLPAPVPLPVPPARAAEGETGPVISVIVPTLGRPGKLPGVVANIASATTVPHEILITAEPGDEATIRAAERLAPAARLVVNSRAPSYAGAVNTAFGEARGRYVFCASDDLRFHPGWAEAALKVLVPPVMVAGTNDLLNEYVQAGRHATHYLIDRRYIEETGGVWGEPAGLVLNEAYDHNFTDTEFIGVARARGVFAPCMESVVEHLHLNNGKSPDDQTYRKGRARISADEKLFRSREPGWTDELSGVL